MSPRAHRILMIDAEAGLASSLRAHPILEGVTFEAANGEADALRRLRRRAYDLVVTNPRTSVSADLALLGEMRAVRPGVKVIVLAPEATPADVIAALRAHVFACFAAPFDPAEVVSMVRRALDSTNWRDGIEVLSAKPEWLSARVDCRLLSADRIVAFLRELRPEVPEAARDEALIGFREILLNAMEHGGRFDPDKVVEVAAVRTERAIVYYVRDPGQGFKPDAMEYAANPDPAADPLGHMEKRLEQGLRPGGFGILMAKNVVDELIFSEHGTEVVLIKRLK
jgi:anti-sigma regulatory factor (Ser/Thr protein kinase)/CheY-like chemotaxis protein